MNCYFAGETYVRFRRLLVVFLGRMAFDSRCRAAQQRSPRGRHRVRHRLARALRHAVELRAPARSGPEPDEQPVAISGTAVQPGNTIRIEGGSQPVTTRVASDHTFRANVPLGLDQSSQLFVSEIFPGGVAGPAPPWIIVPEAPDGPLFPMALTFRSACGAI